MNYRYLHRTSPGNFYLDHRLNIGVRAMLCAMASRMPGGGIEARYGQIVDAVANGIAEEMGAWPWRTKFQEMAEERLCEPSIHPKVQEFFDKFVLKYGHSSIMELSGSPSVYTQSISWYTAYLLFDSPLCSGQEFSTRAVRRKDWPMARECFIPATQGGGVIRVDQELLVGPTTETMIPHPGLKALHDLWLDIFEHEVTAWKDFFSDAANRESYGIQDKEPFRPALDRARWAIPGTIATGCSHTGHLRERSRVLRDGYLLAQKAQWPAAIQVWEEIRDCYSQAAPGLAHMGLREAVYDADTVQLPRHLEFITTTEEDQEEVSLGVRGWESKDLSMLRGREAGQRAYLDPEYNRLAQVFISIRCSLAVARDWHRHRTMYPWNMELVTRDNGTLTIHPAYEVKSEFGKENIDRAIKMATELYWEFIDQDNEYMAMHCLPLGTQTQLRGQGGLRDVVYCLELRRDAHGANFEYKNQATKAMKKLATYLDMCYPGLVSQIGI